MWSDSFRAEERAALGPGRFEVPLSSAAAVVALAALAVEIVLSVEVTTRALTTRSGSWGIGLLAVGLGAVGPYGAAAGWRSPRNADKPFTRRVVTTAVVAVALGCVAVAWLLLIRTAQSHQPLLPF